MNSTVPPIALPSLKPSATTPSRRRCEKIPYGDKKSAISALNYAMRRRRNRPEFLRPYRCDVCNAWHLTHLEEDES